MAIVTRAAHARRTPAFGTFWAVLLVALATSFVALAAAFAVDWAYAERALPGIRVAGVNVGSLSRGDVVARLDGALAQRWADSDVVLTYDGRRWSTTNGALGVRPDVAAAANAAVAYGKTGQPLERIRAWAAALRGRADVPLAAAADGDALVRWVSGIGAEIDREPVSGSIVVGQLGLIVTEPVVGQRLDRSAAIGRILDSSSTGDREIALAVRQTYPAVDESGFRDALRTAQALVTPLAVVAQDRRWDEDAKNLATLLRVERVPAAAGELAPLPAGAAAPAQRYRYTVALSDARVKQWVSALAAQLDRPGVSARYKVSADGGLTVVPGVNGIRIDQEKLTALLLRELATPSAGPREIAAPLTADTATFTTAQATEWLPKLQKTSSFTTPYPWNPSRHANIATGAAQFDGVVVMPGETFSFWERLGPVSADRGYTAAGAIISGRSDDSVLGGGLCQVSTTIFNAVARQGYDVVERHAHAYLIERYPLGLDAAVFDPGLDMRWRNDTGSPVFLWSWVGDTSLTFDVWGLPTGRTVTFSAPVQWAFVDVPKDQPADPAFPKGYAIRGRAASVTRTVTENGSVVHQDTWTSWYSPVWGGPAPEGQALTVR